MASAANNPGSRLLEGWVIGVSVSISEDLAHWGCSTEDVNRTTVRLSEAFLAAGARLAFGHDWRPDGVMDAICRLAVKYQPPDTSITEPLIHNFLPWPQRPAMNSDLRRELEQRRVLKVDSLDIPSCDWQSPDDPLAKAIALSHLRRELARHTDARVCLGGKTGRGSGDPPLGFYAGVIEEAYQSAEADKPVFVARFLGGASARLAAFLEDPSQCGAAREVLEALPARASQYETVASRQQASGAALVPPRDLSQGLSPKRLQDLSGLPPDEWRDALNAPDVEAFATLVIRGLRRHPRPSRAEDAGLTVEESGPPAEPPRRRSRGR